MSIPCEEIRPELETLLASMTEGGLDKGGRRRLSQILRDHPEARQFYLDYCQMHALLVSAHGVLQAFEAPSKKRWVLPTAVAALLLAGAFFWAFTAPPVGTVVHAPGTASVDRNGRQVPLASVASMREGDRLTTGSQGRAQVRLSDGSSLSFAEQTDVRFGRGRITLSDGSLRCDAAPQPAHRPLVFATRHGEASILGTVFDLHASFAETRVETRSGRVRLSSGDRSVEIQSGEVGTADAQDVVRWQPVCSYAFAGMKELPAALETVFCPSSILHTTERKMTAAPDRVRLVPEGLILGTDQSASHGLVVTRGREDLGDDLLMEADVAGGNRWSLGFSLAGDSFEGFRIIFAPHGYPNGISIDTIWPVECIVLAADPRTISYEKDHTLRVERRGKRFRVWVDRELRIDTEITHALSEGRRRTFALSNFGGPPVIRALRVWKAAP